MLVLWETRTPSKWLMSKVKSKLVYSASIVFFGLIRYSIP